MRSFRPYSGIPSLPCNKVWAEIDRSALINNYKVLCGMTPGSRHICVVKADSYGHISAICVDALLDAGCDFFAVSCIEEAIEVRRICNVKNPDADILILSYVDPSYARSLSEYNIIQTVVSRAHADALNVEAEHAHCKLRVHIALDTGMNRVGLCARNDDECALAINAVKDIASKKNLSVEGMFTHFSKADDDEASVFAPDSHTKKQFERFNTVRTALQNDGLSLFCHVCNSAAAVRFPNFALDGVRFGILLYGVMPSRHLQAMTKPVMSLHTVISHIHSLPKGEAVSYGGDFVSDSDRIIATLPIGYADGFLRAYSGASVTVHTKSGSFSSPIVGRICMDQCMIDVTGLGVAVGDKITIFGNDKEQLSSLARLAGTIEYEVLCLISGRVPRIPRKDSSTEQE